MPKLSWAMGQTFKDSKLLQLIIRMKRPLLLTVQLLVLPNGGLET